MLRITLLLLLMALLAPAHAAEPAQPRAFIESTHVIAPQTVAEFRLVESRYDPGNRLVGVRLSYAAVEPATIDVFVYPAGRKPQAEAVHAMTTQFRGDMDRARAVGLYREVQIGPDAPFALEPDPGKDKAAPHDLEARIARAAAETATVGNRIRIALVDQEDGTPLQSLAYLFHRQLNHVKVRITQPADAMPAAAFDAFADRAARTLVASIEALNVGGCGGKTVYVDPGDESEQAMLRMVRDVSRLLAENCVPSAEQGELARKSRGARVERIDFEPGDWGDAR